MTAALDPANALAELERDLSRDPELAGEVRPAEGGAALGALVAAGPRAAGHEAAYAVLIEAIREGHLLHRGESRLLPAADRDLALLAGDYLYALGLDRLAELGDLEAVAELADLISLVSRMLPDGGAGDVATEREVAALWLSTAVAVAAGPSAGHAEGKLRARERDRDAATLLAEAAVAQAAQHGLSEPLAGAAEAIGFPVRELPSSG